MKETLKFAFYTMLHPMDGFYEIRHRERGSLKLAVILVFLFGISFSVNRQYASFVVNDINPMTINSLTEVLVVMALYLLFCIANWSVTCLTEGEGRFKDILIVVGYSMLPMVVTFIPATIFSKGIVQNEEGFYYMLLALSIIWFFILALIGIKTIHNFTLGKTLISLVFVFLSMLVILFLAMLLVSLIGQVCSFFKSIYTEIMLRA